ncbi:MAG TPA: DUF6777 domain-containing protein [Pseudonocardia sp.]|jgi:hypothetical protein
MVAPTESYPAGPYTAPQPPPRKLGARRIIGIVILVGGLFGAVTALVLPGPDGGSDVALVAADSPGADPFVAGGTVTPAPAAAPGLPAPPTLPRNGNAPANYPGTTPGLYAGAKGSSTCNTDQIIGYLEANPQPAAAWATVPKIPASAIRQYVTGLVPVILRTDTQVTSYGLRGDQAIPSQVVLQSNTSVLVDLSGVPRVRCGSGNPLDQARKVSSSSTPTYTGTKWPRFSPSTVIVIVPTRAIGSVIIVDLGGGGVLIRIPGDVGADQVIAVLPRLLRRGDPVNVSGRLFPPGAVVTIRYDEPADELGTVPADGGGNVATTVSIPADSTDGLHQVTAEGGGVTNILPVYILPAGS